MEYITKDFVDSGPNETTHMSPVCEKIFTFTNSISYSAELVADQQTMCHDWLQKALRYCTELVFARPGPSIMRWLMQKDQELKLTLFSVWDLSLAGTLPRTKVNPYSLTRKDCGQLFLDVVEDYVETTPKYSNSRDESVFYQTIFIEFVGLLIIAMILYVCVRAWKNRRKVKIIKKFKKYIWPQEALERCEEDLFQLNKVNINCTAFQILIGYKTDSDEEIPEPTLKVFTNSCKNPENNLTSDAGSESRRVVVPKRRRRPQQLGMGRYMPRLPIVMEEPSSGIAPEGFHLRREE